jgi:hypothetical protein
MQKFLIEMTHAGCQRGKPVRPAAPMLPTAA